jgi:hypothetical protein
MSFHGDDNLAKGFGDTSPFIYFIPKSKNLKGFCLLWFIFLLSLHGTFCSMDQSFFLSHMCFIRKLFHNLRLGFLQNFFFKFYRKGNNSLYLLWFCRKRCPNRFCSSIINSDIYINFNIIIFYRNFFKNKVYINFNTIRFCSKGLKIYFYTIEPPIATKRKR